jgi:hypothetical protein
MIRVLASLNAAFLTLALLIRCEYKNVGPAVYVLPDTVSFSRDIAPLFDENCSTSGCHSHVGPAASLDLSDGYAYAQLWKHKEIDTVNATASVLYIQVNSISNPMPPTGRLPDRSVALILKWIEQKAKKN